MSFKLINAARNGDIKSIKKLLAKGLLKKFLRRMGNINQKDSCGDTVLIVAASHNRSQVVEFLLKKGATINQAGWLGYTALMRAVKNNHLEIVKLLVEKGADVNQKNNSDDTALIIAMEIGNMQLIKILLGKVANINQKNWLGNTALMKAVKNGHLEIVKFLIKNGSDIHQKNIHESDALMLAIKEDYTEIAKYLIEHNLRIDQKFDLKDYQNIFYYPSAIEEIRRKELFQHWEACKKELNTMVIREKSITLHQFLSSLNGKISSEEINNCRDASNFPIYQQYYKKHIEDIENFYYVKQTEMWSSNGTRLNYDVMEKITSYLTADDKKNLLRAAKENATQIFIRNRSATNNQLINSMPAGSNPGYFRRLFSACAGLCLTENVPADVFSKSNC